MPIEAGQLPRYVSHSQRNSFTYCGEQYRLTRVFRIPEKPAYWFAGGSAFHEVTEAMDRRMMGQDVEVPTFQQVFDAQIAATIEKTGYPESEFRAGGRRTNAWPDKENRDWWEHHGPAMVAKYRDWSKAVPYDIHTITGTDEFGIETTTPGIELGIDYPFAGSSIKLFIDRLMRRRTDGALGIVDLKSGANSPPSDSQLGLYKVAAEWQLGEPVTWGTFYDARSGVSGQAFDLSDWTPDRVEYEYETFRYARDKGLFLANPSNQACGGCAVKDFCYVQHGQYADAVPRPWEDEARNPEVYPL